jgi:hypothetical protein
MNQSNIIRESHPEIPDQSDNIKRGESSNDNVGTQIDYPYNNYQIKKLTPIGNIGYSLSSQDLNSSPPRSRSQTPREHQGNKNEKNTYSNNENILKISDSSTLLSKIVKLNQNDKNIFTDIKQDMPEKKSNNKKSDSRSHSKEPFEKLKVKLDGDFVHFLKRHRFSTLMTGNKLYEGKSGDYYLKNKTKSKAEIMDLSISPNTEIKETQKISKINTNNFRQNYENYFNYENNNENQLNIPSLDLSSEIYESMENHIKNESSEKSENSFTSEIKYATIKCINQSNLKKNEINLNNLLNLKENLGKKQVPQKQLSYNKNILNNQEPKKSNLTENQIIKNALTHRKRNSDIISNNNFHEKNVKNNSKMKKLENNDQGLTRRTNPLKKLPLDIGFQKSSQDLTPIPVRISKPDKVLAMEYNQAERAAVTIRRIEYSENVKNKKEEISVEAQNIYLHLLFEAKTVLIQRWWRRKLPKLKILNFNANYIQKNFRGFLSRVAFKTVKRQIYFIYPFLNEINFVFQRKMIKNSFSKIFSNFAILAKNNYLLKKINLIVRTYRRYMKFKIYKRSLLQNSFFIFTKNTLSLALNKIKYFSDFNYKIKKIQSRVKGYLMRNKENFILEKARNYHPFLYYKLTYKKCNNDNYDQAQKKFLFKILKFQSFVKKIYYLKFKKRLERLINIVHNSTKKTCYNLHFYDFKRRMYNYRLRKMKIRMISRNFKELLPIIKRSYKRLFFMLWKKKYLKLKNQCRIVVKCLGEVLRRIIFVPMKNKILLCVKNSENKNKIKKILPIRQRFQTPLIKFEKWRRFNINNKNKEKKLDLLLNKKDYITKKFYFNKLKDLCYYIYNSYPYSLNLYKALEKIKSVAIKNIVRLYHKSDKFSNTLSSFLNLKNLFTKRKLLTKLRKLLKITDVYYENKKKIHFDQWINKINKIVENNFMKKLRLRKIIKSTVRRCSIRLKINFKKWVVKAFRRKIIQQNKECELIKNCFIGFSKLEKFYTKNIYYALYQIKKLCSLKEKNIYILKNEKTQEVKLEKIQKFLKDFILKKESKMKLSFYKIFKLWNVNSQKIKIHDSSIIISLFCRNILLKIIESKKLLKLNQTYKDSVGNDNINISHYFNKLKNGIQQSHIIEDKKKLLEFLLLKKVKSLEELKKDYFIIFRKATDMYFKRIYVRGFRMIFKNKIQTTKSFNFKKLLLKHVLNKKVESYRAILKQKFLIWKEMISKESYMSEELIFKGSILGKLEKIMKRNFLKLLIYYYNIISDVKFIQQFWRTRAKIISEKEKKKFLNKFINKNEENSKK